MDAAGFATAYGLSTSIGLRPFLVLACASVAMHLGYLRPSPSFAFLGSDGATWLLAVLALVEFAGDKFPVVDHTLHVAHVAVKPIAAALLVGGIAPGAPDATTYALMALGAFNALGVHGGVAATRGLSTTMTGGLANPFLSLFEDVVAVGATTLAVAAPFVGAAAALGVTVVLLVLARRVYLAFRHRARDASFAR